MAKILIIEDDPYVRRFYERLFNLNKYDIEMAESGKEGIEKAKVHKPGLILLDIMMPVMNGLEVLQKLKEDPEIRDCSVVMLTNLGDEETVKKAIQMGANGFIVKSAVPPRDLLREVDKYIDLSVSPKT